ncbi:hypothetical protein HG531_012859 [Fusarium graminearum]|nr:hypothetical protein HG531_012859 [Fusarium graminearum]
MTGSETRAWKAETATNIMIPRCDSLGRKDCDDKLGRQSGDKSTNKAPAPKTHWGVLLRPHSSIVTQADLEGEINKNGQSHVILAESLVQKLQVGDTVVSLEANLGDEMNNNDGLDVLKLQNTPHDAVDIPDTIFVLRLVLLLQKSKSNGDNDVGPTPELEVSSEREKTFIRRNGSEPFVGKVGGVESKENSIRHEVASGEANSLRS